MSRPEPPCRYCAQPRNVHHREGNCPGRVTMWGTEYLDRKYRPAFPTYGPDGTQKGWMCI